MATPATAPATGTAAAGQRTCFNTFCKEPTKADGRRRGWRLRSGDSAELCERCLCTYEQGSFCETFHTEVAGWRSCEACGKKVHCGCIVSVHAYVLLDAGGVDCISCARKYFGSVSNQMWMTSSTHHPHPHTTNSSPRFQPMRAPQSPFPGQWRQAGSLWNTSAQSDLQQRLAFEFDRSSSSEKFLHQVRHSTMHQMSNPMISQERKVSEEMVHDRPGPPAGIGSMRFTNGPGAPPLDPANPYSIYHTNSTPNPNPNSSSPNPNSSIPNPNSNPELDHVTMYNSRTGEEQMRYPGVNSPNKGPGFFGQQLDGDMRANGGRPRLDGRNRAQQLLPRYWPRITDQELQQINGESSSSVITPLFEKMLSASDAGRIGRLVLPKKCAEAYFPAIQTPEGLPLTVQDANGKNWTFQFRFWPNNNSRMYVLEGITPCIQAMQLQAGDTVTFSRIDPEGKLVMGFRKAVPIVGEPEIQHLKSGSGFLTSPRPDTNNTNTNINTNITTPNLDSKEPSLQSEPHNPNLNPNPNPTSLFPSRRKPNTTTNIPTTGKISKRLRIENEDSMELKVTWEEAQSLLRPPPSCLPSIILVDGHEFEEYEEPPVLGRRTYFVTHAGETHQWAQCCECMKWRKIPIDALLTAKWTCIENVWDSERASCSSPAELTLEQLVQLMPTRGGGGTKRKLKLEPPIESSSDKLDTLANLALLSSPPHSPSKSPPQSPPRSPARCIPQNTTRHPRHRAGCTCIVCIQPPSGSKGPKHKASCVCNVCITVRRRFRTLMMRKERTSEEVTPGRRLGEVVSGSLIGGEFGIANGIGNSVDDVNVKNNNGTVPSTSSSPMKTQIDLNIQPEKEDDNSPKSVDELAATSAIKLLQEAAAPSPAST